MSVYDVGDVWSQFFYVRDSTGALASAGAVTATITLPDATTASPTVTNPSTGTYLITYSTALTQLGRYGVYVQATGSNACAMSDQFDVRAQTALLSLADARATLNYDAGDTSDDEEIRDYLDVATDLLERRIGPVIPRAITEDVQLAGDGFMPRQPPVISLTSLTPVQTLGITLAAADFAVLSTGKVVRKDGLSLYGGWWYTIVYQAGRQGTVPPRFLQAGRLILKDLWDNQRPKGVRPAIGVDDSIVTGDTWQNVYTLIGRDVLAGIA